MSSRMVPGYHAVTVGGQMWVTRWAPLPQGRASQPRPSDVNTPAGLRNGRLAGAGTRQDEEMRQGESLDPIGYGLGV